VKQQGRKVHVSWLYFPELKVLVTDSSLGISLSVYTCLHRDVASHRTQTVLSHILYDAAMQCSAMGRRRCSASPRRTVLLMSSCKLRGARDGCSPSSLSYVATLCSLMVVPTAGAAADAESSNRDGDGRSASAQAQARVVVGDGDVIAVGGVSCRMGHRGQ
jgi:hypothetical protein